MINHSEMKDTGHVGMPQLCRCPRLLQKSRFLFGLLQKASFDQLQHDRRFKADMLCIIGDAHDTPSQFPERTIGTSENLIMLTEARARLARQNGPRCNLFRDPGAEKTVQATAGTGKADQWSATLLTDEYCPADWGGHW
jgi:hypothetical protein